MSLYFGSLISHRDVSLWQARRPVVVLVMEQLFVLEPAVLLKSFRLLSQFVTPDEEGKKKKKHFHSPVLISATCRGNFDRALIFCYSRALLHTRTVTQSDTVAALYNRCPPLRRVFGVGGFAILLKGTSADDVKGAENLSHSISPHRFSQLAEATLL